MIYIVKDYWTSMSGQQFSETIFTTTSWNKIKDFVRKNDGASFTIESWEDGGKKVQTTYSDEVDIA